LVAPSLLRKELNKFSGIMQLRTRLHLVPTLRISAAVRLLLLYVGREKDRQKNTTNYKKGVYSNMYKLHVSANSGHHQVYYRFKRKSYIWVGVLIIDTRDLFINTPTQIYDFLLNR